MRLKQLVITIAFLLSLVPVSGQSAHALLIAIDKYPTGSGWNEIHATNDLKLLEPLLMQQGFRPENIVILSNQQATKAAIAEALKQLCTHSRTGDFVYIHFSCHGQQMADDNGDETDRLDEALVPYDAPRRYAKERYEGENHLRDDELGTLLDAIRCKTGSKGSVVLTLDACHSGTGDRNYENDIYVRGTSYIFAPPGFIRPEADTKGFMQRIVAHPTMASLTVIAACHPDQLNYEYRCPASGYYYGSLTYALCSIWQGNKTASVNALRETLTRKMNQIKPPRVKVQTPLLQTSDERKGFRIGL